MGRASTIFAKRRAARSTSFSPRYPSARANATSRSAGSAAHASSSVFTARSGCPLARRAWASNRRASVRFESRAGRSSRILTASAGAPFWMRRSASDSSARGLPSTDAVRNALSASASRPSILSRVPRSSHPSASASRYCLSATSGWPARRLASAAAIARSRSVVAPDGGIGEDGERPSGWRG